MTWRLTWGPHSWTEDELTGDHLLLVAAATGSGGWELGPGIGPAFLIANLAAWVALAEGRSFAQVAAEVRGRLAVELLASLSFE